MSIVQCLNQEIALSERTWGSIAFWKGDGGERLGERGVEGAPLEDQIPNDARTATESAVRAAGEEQDDGNV